MDKELQRIADEVEMLSGKLSALKQEIGKVIIGQEETVSQLLITFLAGGHALRGVRFDSNPFSTGIYKEAYNEFSVNFTLIDDISFVYKSLIVLFIIFPSS